MIEKYYEFGPVVEAENIRFENQWLAQAKLIKLAPSDLGETFRRFPGANENFDISDEVERLYNEGVLNELDLEDENQQGGEENVNGVEEENGGQDGGDENNDEEENENEEDGDVCEIRRHYINGRRLNPFPASSRFNMFATTRRLVGSSSPIVLTQRTHPTFGIPLWRHYESEHEDAEDEDPLIGSDPAYELYMRLPLVGYSTDGTSQSEQPSTSQAARMQALGATSSPPRQQQISAPTYTQGIGGYDMDIVHPLYGQVNQYTAWYSYRNAMFGNVAYQASMVNGEPAYPPRYPNIENHFNYTVGDMFLYSPTIHGFYPIPREEPQTLCVCHNPYCPRFGGLVAAATARALLTGREYNTYSPSGNVVPQSWYFETFMALQQAALMQNSRRAQSVNQNSNNGQNEARLVNEEQSTQDCDPAISPPRELANGPPHLHGPYEPLLAHRLANAVEYGLFTANDDDDGPNTMMMNDVLDQIIRLRPEFMETDYDTEQNQNGVIVSPLDQRDENNREEQKILWEECKHRCNEK